MMFANTERRGNRCAQVNDTDFEWTIASLLASRTEALETLSLLYARDCVPPGFICNITKNMIQGKLYQKLKDAVCQLK